MIVAALAAFLISVLVTLLIIGALVGGDDDRDGVAASTSTAAGESTSPEEGMLVAAGRQCDRLARQAALRDGIRWDMRLVDPWDVTATDLAGRPPGVSWRLSAVYAVQKSTDRGRLVSWDQMYRCDVEWTGSEFLAALL